MKKIAILFLVLSLFTMSIGMAYTKNDETVFSTYEDDEEYQKLEVKILNEIYSNAFNKCTLDSKAVVGQYQLKEYEKDSTGTIYYGATKSGTFSLIKNVSLTILGAITKNVKIIIAAAAASIGQALVDVTESGKATAKLGHSYIYLVREGQVYTESGWKTFYISTSRNTYYHEYGLYVDKNNRTRQSVVDHVDNPAVPTQYAPNYEDINKIRDEALNRWYNKLEPGGEDWNGVFPDPPPSKISKKKID